MAGRYPAAWLDELRARADIVQTVSAYVPLKKNGRNYWGLCPFHGEKTASFSVSPEKQMYYCFGCKAGGSVIQFIMDIERLSYQEAVALLAERVHMTLPEMREDPNYEQRREQRNRLLALNREAARIFHEQLFTDAGAPMLEYLRKRGVSDAAIRKFGLGAATSSWDQLYQTLRLKDFTEEELRLAGLCVVDEAHDGKPRRVRDMFRQRVIYPIIDQYGNVLAFGGRCMDGRQPKYLNTSDTPVFNKRLGVYAANLLRKERGLERVILVEGYMDVVALTQFGVRGVCATLGTALTPEQARLLKRFAPKVYLAYDGDSAGQHAILRGLDILAAENIPARVLDFPDGLDPDEFIRRDGPEAFEHLPVLLPEAYRIRRLADSFDLSAQDGRIEYAKACAPILRDLEPVDLEAQLQRLTVQTGFSREVLLEQIGRSAPVQKPTLPQRSHRYEERQTPPGQNPERVRAEETLISLFSTGQLPKDIAEEKDFEDPLLNSLYVALKEGASAPALIEAQETEADRARVSRLLQLPVGRDTDEMLLMARQCLTRLRRSRIEERIDAIQRDINHLEGAEKERAMAEYLALGQSLIELK
ncbi:MAG: DNA primase [Clostridia bacterium]|nr:DNA primase [Clostridia bacterium]